MAKQEGNNQNGVEIRDVAHDGNCFYHAVTDQLKHANITINDQEPNHKLLRDVTIEHMLNNPGLYPDAICKMKSIDRPSVLGTINTREEYLTAHSQDQEFAEELIIGAMSRALGLNISILNPAQETQIIKQNHNPERNIFVYHDGRNHYQSAVPKLEDPNFIALSYKIANQPIDPEYQQYKQNKSQIEKVLTAFAQNKDPDSIQTDFKTALRNTLTLPSDFDPLGLGEHIANQFKPTNDATKDTHYLLELCANLKTESETITSTPNLANQEKQENLKTIASEMISARPVSTPSMPTPVGFQNDHITLQQKQRDIITATSQEGITRVLQNLNHERELDEKKALALYKDFKAGLNNTNPEQKQKTVAQMLEVAQLMSLGVKLKEAKKHDWYKKLSRGTN